MPNCLHLLLKAGLSGSPVEYRWSSAFAYIRAKRTGSLVTPEFILDLLGGFERGRETYRRMLEKSREIDAGVVFEKPDALDGFRRHVAVLFPQVFKSFRKMKKVSHADLLDFEQLEEQIVAVRRKNVGGKPETAKAVKFLIEQLISRGFAKTQIAEMLGVSRKTIFLDGQYL